MNKEELVQAVAIKTNMPKTVSLEESLIAHEDVTIAGFGKFAAKYQKARTARNPVTGGTVDVPAKFSVKFSASSVLKKAVAK